MLRGAATANGSKVNHFALYLFWNWSKVRSVNIIIFGRLQKKVPTLCISIHLFSLLCVCALCEEACALKINGRTLFKSYAIVHIHKEIIE